MKDVNELFGYLREILDEVQGQIQKIEEEVLRSEWEDRQSLIEEIREVKAKREQVLIRVEEIIGNGGKVPDQLRQAIEKVNHEYRVMAQKTAAGKGAQANCRMRTKGP